MNLNLLAEIAQVFEAVFVAVSVFLIWRELRENRRLASAANTGRFVEISSPVYLQLIQDPQIAELWLKGGEEFENLSRVDQYRYKTLIRWWLGFYESIYFQRQWKLLSDADNQAWSRELNDLLETNSFGALWSEVSGIYSDVFVGYIENKLDLKRRNQSHIATEQQQAGEK